MMKWIIVIIGLAVAGFCLFGYLATFELNVSNAIYFRIGYVLIGLSCLLGAAWLIFSRKSSS